VALVVAGCGAGGAGAPPDDPSEPTLTHDDVSAVPDGNAVGMNFSGVYTSVSNLRTACRCRVGGPCALGFAGTGETISVFETDGHLRAPNDNLGGPTELLGGVNADGTFTLGGLLESVGETDFIRFQGQFTLAAGKADSFQATVDRTTQSSSQGKPFDCDFRFVSTWKVGIGN
jgi:hypothetical protein